MTINYFPLQNIISKFFLRDNSWITNSKRKCYFPQHFLWENHFSVHIVPLEAASRIISKNVTQMANKQHCVRKHENPVRFFPASDAATALNTKSAASGKNERCGKQTMNALGNFRSETAVLIYDKNAFPGTIYQGDFEE